MAAATIQPFRNMIASTSTHIFRGRKVPCHRRSNSTTHGNPSFVPNSLTSAGTEIPYADETQPSAAYLPKASGLNSDSAKDAATSETPRLSARQRKVLENIIRVDQAGELGANWIYKGQHAVVKQGRDKRVADLVQEMWDGEKKHIATFDKLVTQHNIRPTLLYPVWKAAGFVLGAGTAMMGNRAAMACTEAVETVIGEHYDSQLKELSKAFPDDHPSIPLLKKILAEFRDDELGHLDTAVSNGAQQTPGYALLSAVIASGCRMAISATKKI